MATYRPFECKFWTDPEIEQFTPEEKLVYAFLFTNTETTESGIYQVSFKYISERTGINLIKINNIIKTLQNNYHKITYDNNVVFVHAFMRRNFKGNPVLLGKSIIKDFQNAPSKACWERFLDVYKFHSICSKIKELLNSCQSVIDTSMNMNMTMNNENESEEEGMQGEKQKRKKREIIIPTIEEVKKYFSENGYPSGLAQKFFDSYSASNPPWHDTNGRPVLSWKQKAINVWFRDENKIQLPQPKRVVI